MGAWDWFRNPENLAAVTAIVSAIWTALWTAFTWAMSRRDTGGRQLPGRAEPQSTQKQKCSLCRWAIGILAIIIAALLYSILFPAGNVVQVCRSQDSTVCPPHDVFIACGQVEDWAEANCIKHSLPDWEYSRGHQGSCGTNLWKLTCYRKPPK